MEHEVKAEVCKDISRAREHRVESRDRVCFRTHVEPGTLLVSNRDCSGETSLDQEGKRSAESCMPFLIVEMISTSRRHDDCVVERLEVEVMTECQANSRH
jgi:hypothetical protein